MTTTQKQAIPPAPNVPASASNAALAAGRSLPGVKPLRIPQPYVDSQNRLQTSQPFQSKSPWQPDPRRPVLRSPVPVKEQSKADLPTQDPKVLPVAAVKNSDRPMMTLSDLENELKMRGMSWMRQQPTKDGVRVMCAFPNPRQPKLLRIYEATALTPEEAVGAVLQQLEK